MSEEVDIFLKVTIFDSVDLDDLRRNLMVFALPDGQVVKMDQVLFKNNVKTSTVRR